MDVGNDTTTGNGRLDQGIKFFVTTNGQLQVSWRNTLDFEVLAGIAGQLQDFGRKIFQYSRRVDGRRGTDTMSMMNRVFQKAMDTTDRKLETRLGGTRLRCLFGGWRLATLASLATLSFS